MCRHLGSAILDFSDVLTKNIRFLNFEKIDFFDYRIVNCAFYLLVTLKSLPFSRKI